MGHDRYPLYPHMIHGEDDVEKYVSEFYSIGRYKRAYTHIIISIIDQNQWLDSEFEQSGPPPIRRSIARPKKLRRKTIDELPNGGARVSRAGVSNH